MPRRIQMSRQHPWRAEHPNAVIVARGTPYGNPFRIHQHCPGKDGDWGVEDTGRFNLPMGHGYTKAGATAAAIALFRHAFDEAFPEGTSHRRAMLDHLRGRDLACWCPLDQPCHADVLLSIAAGEEI